MSAKAYSGFLFHCYTNPKIPAADISEKMHDICEQLHTLEDRLLELKPLLSKLNEQQLRILTKQMSVQCASFIHTLHILFGENPLI
ncbi:hypothetical protein ACFO8Q_07590 [Effusibacillus consociatus]|uniref:Uncharacterized protein n=1 Tax=Effusibacillus consociatus TaxID=1117041 RepID=A0ABV9Q1U2_9BACL